MCAQYIILLLSSHFLLLIMDGTKSLEGAKTTKKMTEDYVMCGSIDESPKSWTLDDGWRCFFSSKSPMKLANRLALPHSTTYMNYVEVEVLILGWI